MPVDSMDGPRYVVDDIGGVTVDPYLADYDAAVAAARAHALRVRVPTRVSQWVAVDGTFRRRTLWRSESGPGRT